jgi:hypothetical protein
MTPDLEAHGPYVLARRGDTTQQVADCSVSVHGADYARQFAATGDMLTTLETILAGGRLTSAEQAMCAAAIAKATGRDVADVVRGSAS